jgi:hypothetical protein
MDSTKKAALCLMSSALILLGGCGQIIGEAIGEALAESMPQIVAASVTKVLLGIGFGQAYYHETGQWPQSVEQIEACCIENDGGDICNLLDDYDRIRFEPNEADPNTIDYEIVFTEGGSMTGRMDKWDYPQDFTFKDIMQVHLTMAVEMIEKVGPNAPPSD